MIENHEGNETPKPSMVKRLNGITALSVIPLSLLTIDG